MLHGIILEDEELVKRMYSTFNYCFIDEDTNSYIGDTTSYVIHDLFSQYSLAYNKSIADGIAHDILSSGYIQQVIHEGLITYITNIVDRMLHNSISEVFSLFSSNYITTIENIPIKTILVPNLQEVFNRYNIELYPTDEFTLHRLIVDHVKFILLRLLSKNKHKLMEETMQLINILIPQLQTIEKKLIRVELTTKLKILILTK